MLRAAGERPSVLRAVELVHGVRSAPPRRRPGRRACGPGRERARRRGPARRPTLPSWPRPPARWAPRAIRRSPPAERPRGHQELNVVWLARAPPARRRSASVLPARGAPTTLTRDPLPNGVSHSIALMVGSSEPRRKRSEGYAAGGKSSKRGPSATSAAGRPLIVSIRTSEGKRSERRGARRGPEIRSPAISSQRFTWAAEM